MRFILLLFFITYSLASYAKPAVVLLVSLNNPKHRPIFRTQDWSLSENLIQYFKQKLGAIPYDLVVINNATDENLHQELTNPKNIALFWISHAGSFQNGDDGLGVEDLILDKEGKNLKDIFKRIHPNLRYLSILGCKARPILTNLKKEGFLKENNELIIYAKERNIFAKKEIRSSIKDFKKNISSMEEVKSPCPKRVGHPLLISREIPLISSKEREVTSARVLHQNKFLGLFPKAFPGEVQNITVYIDNEKYSRPHELKIILDSGHTQKDKSLNLGKLKINSDNFQGSWHPFIDNQGHFLGISQHIYRYSGLIETQNPPVSYIPYQCL